MAKIQIKNLFDNSSDFSLTQLSVREQEEVIGGNNPNIQRATELDFIVSDYDRTTFRPAKPVTRAELIDVLRNTE